MSADCKPVFRLGLVVNPFAGVGGPTANKGSDDPEVLRRAGAGQLPLTAPGRAKSFLRTLLSKVPGAEQFVIVTVPGAMGSAVVEGLDAAVELVEYYPQQPSSYRDTEAAATAIVQAGVDLLVFVGGDGTARDVYRVIGSQQPALGVPAGVKMHSGVYAITPQLAAEVVAMLVVGDLVNLAPQEVRDIDEEAFRQGKVKSRPYGEMLVPEEGQFVQQVKQGGLEVEELVLLDIAEHLREDLTKDTLMIIGPGSTTLQILQNWRLDGTLLGVDLVLNNTLLAADVDAATINAAVTDHRGPTALVVTAIGGQGHIIGRGNQQITPSVLRHVGREQLHVVATKTKLKTLDGRPLVMDSGDPSLDQSWQGYLPVITGYQDVVLYPLGR